MGDVCLGLFCSGRHGARSIGANARVFQGQPKPRLTARAEPNNQRYDGDPRKKIGGLDYEDFRTMAPVVGVLAITGLGGCATTESEFEDGGAHTEACSRKVGACLNSCYKIELGKPCTS